MKRKLLSLLLALVLTLNLCACGGGNENKDKDNSILAGQADEDDFEWDNDIIIGMTDAGMKKTKLVIPARCKGFQGTLFVPGMTQTTQVVFEGTDHIDFGELFCFVETLEQVTLPAQQQNIPFRAFCGCNAMKQITIPGSVTEIQDEAFQMSSGLETVTVEGSALTTIGTRAFSYCNALISITLPDSVTAIGEYAFEGCYALKEFTLPASVKTIGAHAFADVELTDLYIPEDVVLDSMGDYAFEPSLDLMRIHVVEGSWMDLHFDELFDFSCEKVYD